MKILINTSNLNKGGALQVAHSFLTEIKNNTEIQFYVILSSSLNKQINLEAYPKNFVFYNYSIKPSILKAITGKDRFLNKIENQIFPDCIFSVFGPTYWIPKAPHLMGYAIPHHIYLESPFFRKIGLKLKVNSILLRIIHRFNLKKSNATFCVETNDVKFRLAKFLNIENKFIHTITNTYNSVFDSYCLISGLDQKMLPSIKDDKKVFKLLTVSADYPHKNLDILKKIVPILILNKINCIFYLTLPEKAFLKFRKYKDYIVNLGPVSIEKCPELYSKIDALFLPTLLECFSASYPEAMKMGKPILTSNLPFAQDICGGAAEYFNPLDPKDIVDKIQKIIYDKDRREYLIREGTKRLENFETSTSRAERYLDICKQLMSIHESTK